jgi:hypothetical protein
VGAVVVEFTIDVLLSAYMLAQRRLAAMGVAH